ncbi:cold shock domain protein CspD [Candidatus Endobugula sertula]|uniref:Cold shock-like protein CspD n=1 Tax=Candidatus Endobugula sertula TaxID=62101 RepID=A0A1D2QPE4_9GAMM|nr:cold shock domain protein CspD [Candidatus Endobugula sertula]
MATGTVKWFNNAKGYGFILPDNGGDDLFAHYSSIEMEGYKTLKAGQIVSFNVVEGDKGLHATHITANIDNNTSPTYNINADLVDINQSHIETT